MTEEIIGRKILVPEHPQLTGAVGAALYAIDSISTESSPIGRGFSKRNTL
jgi:activator of 2-hydroxyglutaryl-CoA dehydratase